MANSDAVEATPSESPRTIVYLGNRKAVETVRSDDGQEVSRNALPGKRCTTVTFPKGISLMEAMQAVTSPQGVWAAHSDADAPAWVAASGPLADGLTQLLAAQWPGVEVREPEPEEG